MRDTDMKQWYEWSWSKTQRSKIAGAVQILICTDGAFSMDGVIANLKGICDLADKYEAMVMTDECHCTGFLGKTEEALLKLMM